MPLIHKCRRCGNESNVAAQTADNPLGQITQTMRESSEHWVESRALAYDLCAECGNLYELLCEKLQGSTLANGWFGKLADAWIERRDLWEVFRAMIDDLDSLAVEAVATGATLTVEQAEQLRAK